MIIKKSSMVLGAVLLAALSSASLIAKDKVIYGEDNRQEVYEANSDMATWALSTAAMIHVDKLSKADPAQGTVEVTGRTLAQMGICKEEKFSEQRASATCSGFFVGKDILVTAGHCVRSQGYCDNYAWVFDYRINNSLKVQDYKIPKESVYRCKEIISQVLDYQSKDDYAVIKLDREVTNREPLELRWDGQIDRGEEIVVIGHPIGLPTKVADMAFVRSTAPDKYFVANLDTYGGNSGSAVINRGTGEVEGILVRGEYDFVWDQQKNCRSSKICEDDGCRGEDITRIGNLREILKPLI